MLQTHEIYIYRHSHRVKENRNLKPHFLSCSIYWCWCVPVPRKKFFLFHFLLSAEMANNVQLMTIIYSCYDHIKKAKNFSFINGDYERCTVKCLYNIPPLQNHILLFPKDCFHCSCHCI